jgi:hypothetical protein
MYLDDTINELSGLRLKMFAFARNSQKDLFSNNLAIFAVHLHFLGENGVQGAERCQAYEGSEAGGAARG